jgi:hypothetical protein
MAVTLAATHNYTYWVANYGTLSCEIHQSKGLCIDGALRQTQFNDNFWISLVKNGVLKPTELSGPIDTATSLSRDTVVPKVLQNLKECHDAYLNMCIFKTIEMKNTIGLSRIIQLGGSLATRCGGRTPLATAIDAYDSACVKVLIDAKANVNDHVKEEGNQNNKVLPLRYAASKRQNGYYYNQNNAQVEAQNAQVNAIITLLKAAGAKEY